MKCNYCGAEIDDDSIFCSKCGKDVRQNTSVQRGVVQTNQSSNWYYAEGENYKGPFSAIELKSLFDTGVIQLNTYVWKEGMDDWISYQESELASSSDPTMIESNSNATVADTGYWYYFKDNVVTGPFSEETIIELYLKGVINQGTNICKQGYEEWILFKNSGFMDVISQLVDDPGDVAKITKDYMDDWYYGDNFTHHGPFTEAKIIDLYNTNKISDSTMVWKTGAQKRFMFKESELYSKADHQRHREQEIKDTQKKKTQVDTKEANQPKQQKDSKINIILILLAAGLLVCLIFGISMLSSDSSRSTEDGNSEDSYAEVEDTYTYIYTDGVPDETVFEDKIFEDISKYDDEPSFTAPARSGYVFTRWERVEDSSDPYTITYKAVWEKEVDPDVGYYVTNYVMSIRTGPNRHTTLLREIPQGSTVYIIAVDRNSDGTWGQISENEWICLSDTQYIYCSKK